MAKGKQIASSAKPARSARKGAAAGKKGVEPKPVRQGRRAAKAAPEVNRGGTKQARVIALLERDSGATLDELVAATGWLPHTTRAALTGLHGGKSTGPRTPERLERSRRANWKHSHHSVGAKADRARGRQIFRELRRLLATAGL